MLEACKARHPYIGTANLISLHFFKTAPLGLPFALQLGSSSISVLVAHAPN